SGAPEASQISGSEQTVLAGRLLAYMAQRLCWSVDPDVFDWICFDSGPVREAYSFQKQFEARNGALMCRQGLTALGIVCACLERWGHRKAWAAVLLHPCGRC
ncbi:MAG: hypothetical protein AB3N24_01335, partial [Leisingera sp.]